MTRARRARLITDNIPMVKRVARQVARHFSPLLSIEDFEQDGMMGLCEAAARCTAIPTFERFAYFRVRGAMVDSHRRKAYREDLNPSADGMQQVAGFVHEQPGGLGPVSEDATPGEALEQAQAGIFASVWTLPVRHQRIIVARYITGLSIKEIGQRLSLSATQIRMLHAEAIAMLRPAAERMR